MRGVERSEDDVLVISIDRLIPALRVAARIRSWTPGLWGAGAGLTPRERQGAPIAQWTSLLVAE
jgi:hypothetical protein